MRLTTAAGSPICIALDMHQCTPLFRFGVAHICVLACLLLASLYILKHAVQPLLLVIGLPPNPKTVVHPLSTGVRPVSDVDRHHRSAAAPAAEGALPLDAADAFLATADLTELSSAQGYELSNATQLDQVQAILAPLLARFGNATNSYLSLVNPEHWHFVLPGIGALPFCRASGYGRQLAMCVSDPLCHPSGYEPLVRAFLKRYPSAMFFHISEPFARALNKLGLCVNFFGTEVDIDASAFR